MKLLGSVLVTLVASLGLSAATFGELAIGAKAPELIAPSADWVGAAHPTSLAALRGKVVLLHFWTFGCINCKHNLPAYARLQATFKGAPVTMIGIHTPETREEASLTNLGAAAKRLGIGFPALHDPAGTNWRRYEVNYWPTLYVIDKRGIVRGVYVGELNYGGRDGESEVSALVRLLAAE
jgi:peroxiredoxin